MRIPKLNTPYHVMESETAEAFDKPSGGFCKIKNVLRIPLKQGSGQLMTCSILSMDRLDKNSSIQQPYSL